MAHAALPAYRIIEMGLLNPQAINSSGQIAGYEYQSHVSQMHAILREPDGTIRHLPMLPGSTGAWACDINDSGQVVGYTRDADNRPHAVMWDAAGNIAEIPVPAGTLVSDAWGINNLGQVVGTFSNVGSRTFLWSPSDGFVDLSPRATFANRDWAYMGDINDDGYITGTCSVPTGSSTASHAVLWKPDGTAQDLGSWTNLSSFGRAINDAGQVLLDVSSGTHQVWTSSGMTPLPGFSGIGLSSSGEVVGSRWTGSASRAVYWSQSSGMLDLSVKPEWTGCTAYRINDSKWIIGTSYQTYSYNTRGVLWTTVPEPSGLLALSAGLAGICGMLRRRR